MSNEYTIHRAKTPQDIDAVLKIQKTTWVETYHNEDKGVTKKMIEDYFTQKWTEEYIQSRYDSLKDKTRCTWLAKQKDDNAVGWISTAKSIVDQKVEGSFAVYVLPEYQGYGIGKSLMEIALQWLSDVDYIRILAMNYNKRAITWYKKIGFVESGETKDLVLGDFVGKNWEIEFIKKL